jgi:hypothetical protein
MEDIIYSELDTTGLEEIGAGSNGTVYRYDDVAIKVYDNVSYDSKNIDIDIFDDLRDIDLDSFIKLIDCSTILCEKDSYCPKNRDKYCHREKEIVRAYSSMYVEPSKELLIDKPIDYTLNSLYEFKSLLEELNQKKILIGDAHQNNCVITDDRLVIVDPDLYRYHPNPDKINVKRIKEYIVSIWLDEYKVEDYYDLRRLSDYFKGSTIEESITNMKEKVKSRTPRELLDKHFNELGM